MSIFKSIYIAFLFIVPVLSITGYSTKVSPYFINRTTIEKLSTFHKNIKIIASKNAIDDKTASARMSSIVTPHGESFNNYIVHAFNEEIKHAKIHNKVKNDILILIFELQSIKLSTLGGAYWEFEVKLSSNNKSFTTTYTHNFISSVSGDRAVKRSAIEFKYAVQGLIEDIVYNQKFYILVTT